MVNIHQHTTRYWSKVDLAPCWASFYAPLAASGYVVKGDARLSAYLLT